MVKNIKIGGLNISRMGLEETANLVLRMAEKGKGLKIACCSLNDLMMTGQDIEFRKAIRKVDIRTTDGMPLVWFMRYKTGRGERVYGPDLMRKILSSKSKVLEKQAFIGDEKNKEYFKKIGEYIVLPFKDEFEKADYERVVNRIKKSRAKIVWVGLGSKKQVIMADELSKKLNNKVYLTVGAAFDFLSGTKRQCPKLIRNMGGEWLFRWITEPKRLTKRYLEIIKFVFNSGLKYINDKK